ncbi:MAG TPA: cobalamin-binding protein [Terracidiphilus sp.]|jgi:iron complex transport system substrate-binding protein|nr:cobalamin-binding protein [Terracidiphilus sp.]
MKQIFVFLVFSIAMPAWCTRTVTDELGRVVVVPDHPHRLVCLMPSVVDDVYALGAGADVVAVTDYTRYPPEARTKPSVGSTVTPSIETIVALHPDLVLQSGNMSRPEAVEALEKLGIAVFVIAPHGVEGIYQSISSLGRALNREESAKALVSSLRGREAAVRRQVSGKPVVSLLMPVWYNPILTIGKHAFITDLIEIAGGHSITSDLSQEWPQVSLETVLARAPEALLLMKGSKMSMDKIRGQPGWDDLPAVKNNRVYYVDDRIELSSPVAFDALEELAKQIHP